MKIPFVVKKPTGIPESIWVVKEDRFKKENDISSSILLPVSGLTEDEALQYCELWKEAFMEKWEKSSGQRRQNNANAVLSFE